MVRRFVITGCSRSGTKYMSKLLTSLGCETSHDKSFLYHRKFNFDWDVPPYGGASWYVAPVLFKLPQETIIFHQIRNPLEFIRSRFKKGKADFMWVKRFVKDPRNSRNFYAKLWIKWNKFVENIGAPIRYYKSKFSRKNLKKVMKHFFENPVRTLRYCFSIFINIFYMRFRRRIYYYRIEDLNINLITKIFTLIDFLYKKDKIEEIYNQIPKNVNTTGPYKDEVNLGDIGGKIRRYRLKKYAQEFGYIL